MWTAYDSRPIISQYPMMFSVKDKTWFATCSRSLDKGTVGHIESQRLVNAPYRA
jgi:hypothetical protein